MDRRAITGTICAAALSGGLAALIGATALPDSSSYFTILMISGLAGCCIGVVGLVLLFLFPATEQRSPRHVQAIEEGPPPPDLDDRSKALWLLRQARENAVQARRQWGSDAAQRAYFEITAAMLGIEREFGCGGKLRLSADSDEPSYKDMLAAYIAFADVIYPLLQGGHIERAQKASKSFSWNRGWD